MIVACSLSDEECDLQSFNHGNVQVGSLFKVFYSVVGGGESSAVLNLTRYVTASFFFFFSEGRGVGRERENITKHIPFYHLS